jgi:hypothetical protein
LLKINSEASLRLEANYLFVRGLEQLMVTKNLDMARSLFEEAMKCRPDNIQWHSKCLSYLARCESSQSKAKYLASKALKFSSEARKLDALLVSIEVNQDSPKKVEDCLLELAK